MTALSRRWAMLSSRGRQHGATTTLATVIWLPVLLGIVLVLGIGYGMWSYSRELVQGAAEIGAQQAALSPYSASRGEAAARDFLERTGSSVLTDVAVTVESSAGTVSVTVNGSALGPIGPSVTSTVTLAREPALAETP